MTMPDERARALVWAGGLLLELAHDERLPADVRQTAVQIARNFPTLGEIAYACRGVPIAVKGAAVEGLKLAGAECAYGPLTDGTQVDWPEGEDDQGDTEQLTLTMPVESIRDLRAVAARGGIPLAEWVRTRLELEATVDPGELRDLVNELRGRRKTQARA